MRGAWGERGEGAQPESEERVRVSRDTPVSEWPAAARSGLDAESGLRAEPHRRQVARRVTRSVVCVRVRRRPWIGGVGRAGAARVGLAVVAKVVKTIATTPGQRVLAPV